MTAAIAEVWAAPTLSVMIPNYNAAAVAMRDRRDDAAAEVSARIGAARERITSALVPRLQQAVRA